MKRTLNILSALLLALALLAGDITPAFAQTEKPETAAKTVNISIKDTEDETDEESAEDDEKKAEKDAEKKIKNEDGESEKTDNYFIERPDPAEMTEIKIGSYDEWCDFARKCAYDEWSKDKYVVLTDTIDCSMKKIVPAPYFAGIFDGNGYTVNKAAFTEEQNYVGLFSKTAPTAVIRNLNVIGVMKPEGKPFNIGGIVGSNAGMIANCKYEGFVDGYDYIGGIAGYNEASGIISACSVKGKVTGLHYVGGICGANAGLVTGCSSAADINTVTKEVETGLRDIKVEEVFTSLINIGREDGNKKSITQSNTPVDIGGIVGHNFGEVSSCSSDSTVGYEHVGYNVGGIVGRNSGYVHDSVNRGGLNGRKDVGGIVGQAEPYIRLDLTKDIITQLNTAINSLHDSVDKTIKDTDASSGVVSARLNVIKNFADNALSDTGYLSNSTIDFVNGATGATNEIVGRLEYVISETSSDEGPMQDVENAGEDLRKAAVDVEKVAEDMNIYKYMSESETENYNNAKKNIEDANKEYERVRNIYISGTDAEVNAIKPLHVPQRATERNTERSNGINAAMKKLYEEEHPGADWDTLPAADKAAYTAAHQAEADAAGAAAVEEWATTAAAEDTDYATKLATNGDTIAGIILSHEGEMTSDAKADGKDAGKNLKKMATNLRDAGKGMKNILKSVASSGSVRFPQLSEEYRMRTNSLVANIQGMSDNLGFLNNEMKGSTDVVCGDLEKVNDDFSSIMLLFTDAMDGVLDMDYSELYEDESNDVCETSVDATIADCSNFGSIYGDINTGGIAGTMAEEYDFDLEGDITGIKDSAKNSTYRTKCVARQNVNRGDVKGKKSYAGGVCGLHEIGTILRCYNFAKAASESGDYVGGIAGRSYATITSSYEKGVLDGESYIGGIAGSGAIVTDCVAMPNITGGTTFLGAIVGSDDDGAKLKNNIFVSDTLAGADRISRAGQAEPVSYAELLSMENIPGDYSLMRVDFIVGGKVVSTEQKKMGEVVTPAETPLENVIAKREGDADAKGKDDNKIELAADEYIDWDCDEEIPVYEDMEIKGEVVRYVTSLASEQVRSNRQSVFLVDGRFLHEDELKVDALSGSPEDTEEFILTIPDDGADTHMIRYQMPEDAAVVKIYTGGNGAGDEVSFEEYGDYLTFEATGNKVNVRIEKQTADDWTTVLIYAGCGLAGLIIVVVLLIVAIRLIRRDRHKDKRRDDHKDKNKHKDKPDKGKSDEDDRKTE